MCSFSKRWASSVTVMACRSASRLAAGSSPFLVAAIIVMARCLLASEYATWSEIEAPRAAACAVLHHVTFSAAWEYAEPKAGQVLIPNEIVPVPNLGGIHKALRQLGHLNKDSRNCFLFSNRAQVQEAHRKQAGASRSECARKPTLL